VNLTIIQTGKKNYAAGIPGQQLMRTIEDAMAIIEFCFENQLDRVMLYADNFTDRFFDLSSREAGLLLQKFRNYHIKVAAVVSLETTPHSRNFPEMVAEENRRGDFHLCADPEEAEAWLLQNV
jgi:hypothetical protein